MTQPVTQNHFVLTFNTSLGRAGTIRVPRADGSKTNADIDTSMNNLVDTGMLLFNDGSVISPKGTYFVETTTTTVIEP